MLPHLIHIYGPVWIQTYGVMIALGFLLFLFLSIKHPLRKKYLSTEQYLNTVFIGLASGIIGGRLLYIFANPHDFAQNWLEVLFPWVGGFFVLGSIGGVLIAVPLYLWWQRIPVLPVMDLAGLYGSLIQVIARLGCLGAGCCYGAAAPGLWWAITFTNPQASTPLEFLNTPLHPTQLYISLASLIIFLILRKLSNTLIKTPGSLLFMFLLLENTSRITIDFWRGDREPIIARLFAGNITISQAQLFSLIALVISLSGFIWIQSLKTKSHK